MSTTYDYIIVGSGAGGSAAAYQLSRAGARVLLLEKGQPLPDDGSTLDVDKVFAESVFKNKESWCDGQGRRFIPEEYFNLGGKTKWYGAALLRFSPQEFGADREHQCRAWPFRYDELAPYYLEAEALLGLQRFEPEAALSSLSTHLTNGAGWRAEPLPLGLHRNILDDPLEASQFDGFASARGFKADAERAFLDRVRLNTKLTIAVGCEVINLIADENDARRVVGVQCKEGARFYARSTLLAAGAMHSPRLLRRFIRSRSLEALPCFVAAGRNMKLHLLTAVLGFSSSVKSDVLRKTLLFVHDRFSHSSVQPLGFGPAIIKRLLPRLLPHPVRTSLAARAYGFFLQTEDGSHLDNRVNETETGVPVLDYQPQRCAPAVKEHRALVRRFRKDLFKAGYVSGAEAIPLSGTAHACGTLITGEDPYTSVVDGNGQVHGLQNLYVVDGSVLPRSSRVNPALTIFAWALRVADRLEPQGGASHVY